MELEVSQASLLGQNIGGKNHNGIKTNAVAPRLFCDICDLFDLHDTEDCPKQASDDVIETPSMMLYIDSPSSNEHSRHGGRREQSRPYCEVCEIFGHATGDCDEDATFWSWPWVQSKLSPLSIIPCQSAYKYGKQKFCQLVFWTLCISPTLCLLYHFYFQYTSFQSKPSFLSLTASLNLSSNRESSEIRSVIAFIRPSCGE